MDRYEIWYNLVSSIWHERTFDSRGNQIVYKNSRGYCSESTYDKSGNQLTYKNSWYNE